MNTEIKVKWVDELRNGGREQAEGFLRQGDAYCCLGVLCDLIAPDNWVAATEEERSAYDNADGVFVIDGVIELLPEGVSEVTGLSDNPTVDIPCWHEPTAVSKLSCSAIAGWESVKLSDLNDEGFTFNQIADLIDMQL